MDLYGTPDATALSTAECLPQHFGRFRAPRQLRSDNGPHFIADVIKEFLTLVGIAQCLTLAYSKEENAIVERFHKEINRHLRALTFDNLSIGDYRKSLPFVQRILNANHSDRLKISASQMLFGGMLDLDVGIFDKFPNRSANPKKYKRLHSRLTVLGMYTCPYTRHEPLSIT